MDSRLISKLDKARRYANEPERVAVRECTLTFRGDNDNHSVALSDGAWQCTCGEFARTGDCAHVMAVRYMLTRTFSGAQVDHAAHLLAGI